MQSYECPGCGEQVFFDHHNCNRMAGIEPLRYGGGAGGGKTERLVSLKCSFTVARADNAAVWIKDTGAPYNRYRTVTNDAEAVVARLAQTHFGVREGKLRVFYCDSNGDWDELRHDCGRMIDFAHGTGGLRPPLNV